MKNTLQSRALTSILLIGGILFTVTAYAQSSETFRRTERDIESAKKDHLGFTVSFGARSSTLTSNYEAIDGMQALEEGGSAGILWGSRAFETKFTVGYYYSAASVNHTTDMIEMEASSNFYPLRAIKKRNTRLNPFLSAGVTKNYYKLYGFYTQEGKGIVNYSVSREPYLGNLNVYNASLGAGLAVSLLNEYDFVKIFAATYYNKPFSTNASTDFRQTTTSSQWSFNLGVSFGTNRLK